MSRSLEKALLALALAGISTIAMLLRAPDGNPDIGLASLPASAETSNTLAAEPPATTGTGTPSTGPPGVGRTCTPVEELWREDGYRVEDPCTLAEVKRVFRWAWTGTETQRRSAIRNSHLLDEVFVALDDYGRTHEAGLFDPETRGDWTVVFDDIRWRGGPEPDRAVIAVTHGFTHVDYPESPRWTSTVVLVGGEWKLSYRRSYCLPADSILERLGSDLRCSPESEPDINEDEDPDTLRGYADERDWYSNSAFPVPADRRSGRLVDGGEPAGRRRSVGVGAERRRPARDLMEPGSDSRDMGLGAALEPLDGVAMLIDGYRPGYRQSGLSSVVEGQSGVEPLWSGNPASPAGQDQLV